MNDEEILGFYKYSVGLGGYRSTVIKISEFRFRTGPETDVLTTVVYHQKTTKLRVWSRSDVEEI